MLFSQSTSVNFNYTGSSQNWVVPSCVTSITVNVAGAEGGGANGGNGALITGNINVTPGQTLQIKVGGEGSCPNAGYNGGGLGGSANSTSNNGCGGGGATDIRVAPFQLNDRIIVAAGGGGMGGGNTDADGGEGGCSSGIAGTSPFGVGGGGASQTNGGSGGPPWISSGNSGNIGSLGIGGNGAIDPCYNLGPGGGGGGGYYGGGGGGSDCFSFGSLGGGGGGGGSSLTPSGFTCIANNNSNDGYVIITYSVTNNSSTDTQSHCNSFVWLDNITYTASNNTATYTYYTGICDSIVYLDLTINNSTSNLINQTSCDIYTWPQNNQTYTTSGTYTDVSTNSAGCTHIDSLNLIIDNSTSNLINQTSCDTYTWSQNNQTYTTSGTYTDVSTNSAGCTHIDTLNLTIDNSTSNLINQTSCDIYTWPQNNQTYTTSGTYTDVSTNSAGCTHIDTLSLTIDNSTSNLINQTACDLYIWNNQTYYTSGIYTHVSINSVGCIHTDTLNLTIDNSTANTTPITACDSYTWLQNNQTYTTSGTYVDSSINAAGCTHTEILHLVVGYTDDIDLLIDETNISCFGYNDGSIILNPYGGTPPYQFLWANGSTNQGIVSLSAGTYPFTITDFNECTIDSVSIIEEANQVLLDFIATSPICRYDESTLSIHISNSTSNTYTISLQDSILKSFVIDTNGLLIPEGVPITLTPNFSGEVIIISITDNTGCTGVFNDDVHIEIKQLPILNLNEDDICVGESSYTLSNATPLGGTYFINDAMNDYFDVENLETGGYYIRYEYTDPITSCYNEIEEVITINESPTADFTFSPQPTDLNNPDIFFRDNSDDLMTSVWNLGDGTIIYDELSFWHTYSAIGTYIIRYYITNQYNCTDSVIETLVINPVYNTFIPLAFTPNDDGDNDYFYPSIIGGNNYNMKIYDRWGGIIYNEDNGKWDGKMNTNFIINGLFSYSITVFDFKDKPFNYTGLVTLIK